jgi:acylphosphatase
MTTRAAESHARVRLIVKGRVQGVFFRRSTVDTARTLGLTGWVRNLPSGDQVEIIAEGRRRDLESLVAWAHTGPPGAHVESVDEQWSECRMEFNDFRVR